MSTIKNLYITTLRNKLATRSEFRLAAENLAHILALEALEHIPTTTIPVETPWQATTGIIHQHPVMLLPILRSGITMLPIFLRYFPDASIGVVGIRRDEQTAKPSLYYKNLPPLTNNTVVIILDPMIATGGTGSMVLNMLQELAIAQEKTLFCSMIAAPEGLDVLAAQAPAVTYITGMIDKGLNSHKFIVPGIGDFGDRYFGTID